MFGVSVAFRALRILGVFEVLGGFGIFECLHSEKPMKYEIVVFAYRCLG